MEALVREEIFTFGEFGQVDPISKPTKLLWDLLTANSAHNHYLYGKLSNNLPNLHRDRMNLPALQLMKGMVASLEHFKNIIRHMLILRRTSKCKHT